MQVSTLNVEFRKDTLKTTKRTLKNAGKIPAVVYGGGKDPINLALNPAELVKALDPVKRTNTVIKMIVQGGAGGNEEILVMVRDHQKDALKGNLTHADFVRVALDKPVHATVPLILTGKCEGVKLGGIMHQVLRHLEIACTPDKIPDKIEVDVTALGMGDAVHVSDLKLTEGVKPRLAGGQTICSVTAPKAEKVVEAVVVADAAAAVPGAAAAAGAPAAAGAAPAKDAKAAAPAKDEKKK